MAVEKFLFMKQFYSRLVKGFAMIFLIGLMPILAKAQCSISVSSASISPCAGWSNGQITATMANAVNYQLMPGNVNNTNGLFTGLSAGIYTLTGTDASACTASTTVSLIQSPPMNVVLNATPVNCGAWYSGTISVVANGGAPPYTINISPNINPIITPGNPYVFSGLMATSYTITVSDANGCNTTAITFVPQTPSPQIQLSNFVNPSCVGVCNGSMNYTAINGTPPYTYTVIPSVPFGGGTFNNLCSGNYTVTVTDANGCTGFQSHAFIPQNTLILNNTVTPISCGSNCSGSIVPVATGGIAPYTYSINGNQFNNLCVNNYTVTATDVNNCTQTSVIQLLTSTTNQFMYPNATVGNGSISASATGGTPPYQYSLNGGPFSTNNTFNYLCSGTYTLTVKDNYFGGCLKDTIITVQAGNTLPGVTFNTNIIQPSCNLSQNGSIQLIAVPAGSYTYMWNTNVTGPSLNNLNAGTYSVSITNALNQCIEMNFPLTALGGNCGDITGVVYYDSILNCTQDAIEQGIPGTMITANPGNHITFTDATGHYSFLGLPYGSYTLTHANNVNAYATHCGNALSVNISNGAPTASAHFGDSITVFTDYQVWVNNPNCFAIANPTKLKVIRYKHNHPLYNSTGTVYALFDSIQHFAMSNPAPSSVSGNVVSWNLSSITDNAGYIWVYFTLPTGFTIQNTEPFQVGINNLQYPDTNVLNNQISYTFPICNGYDPNDKSVAPKGIGPDGLITMDQSLLTYTIRFQNTGNAPAYNIVIVDTLSDKLDLSTLNMPDVSHNYQLEVIDNKILTWKFYNIMLPDSGTNYAASMGHIVYQIRLKNGVQLGDQIKNKAYIYFDYNPAIITNETMNTLYMPSGISNTLENKAVIYPNPTEDILFIDANEAFTRYRLMDASLRIVKQDHFTATRQQKVDVHQLSAGIYFLQVGEGKLKKVVVR